MKFKVFAFLIIFFLPEKSFSQDTKTEMALYNVGINSVFSGIGALINKKPNEKWHKVLLKGMGQGALGGYLIYESKNLIGKIESEKKWEYGWYGKLVNSAGTSITENASSNRNFWEKWHINFGFNRLEFHTKEKFKIKYKIMPVSLSIFLYSAIRNEFEFKKSLQTGELIFSTNNDNEYKGFAIGNIITVNKNEIDSYDLYSHEIIHIYQYYDFSFINSYFKKPLNKWKSKSKIFNKIETILHFEFQAPILRGLYLLENINRNNYYDNFFENEAGFYSNTIRK